jgi:DNA modification methylase
VQIECRHEWQTEVVSTEVGKGNWSQGVNGRGELQPGGVDAKREPIRAEQTRGFCRLCGAWLGCYGLEPTIALYVAHTVEICAAIWRVLKPTGSVWWNVGDSYAGSGRGPSGGSGLGGQEERQGFVGSPVGLNRGGRRQTAGESGAMGDAWVKPPPGMKAKDLCLIPYRVAIALQEAGWWVREDVIWAKTSCMPESVTDRCTRSHEYIFHLTKRATYYHDAEAIREASQPESEGRYKYAFSGAPEGRHDPNGHERIVPEGIREFVAGRNARSVWTIGPEPLREAHYAAFPSEIPRRCILASSSERGCCPTCGKPWVRVTERTGGPPTGDHRLRDDFQQSDYNANAHPDGVVTGASLSAVYRKYGYAESTTLGWSPSCSCPPAEPIPATVLDPFVGSGTTLVVARALGRRGIGIDASDVYLRTIAIPRIEAQTPSMFSLELETADEG